MSIRNVCVLFAIALTSAVFCTRAHAQVQFGAGCPAGTTTPVVDMQGDPRVGNEVRYRMLLAPPNALAVLFTGLSDRTWSGAPLPLDLRPWLGPASSCRLLVAADTITTAMTGNTGMAGVDFYIPQHPALVGLSLYSQWGAFHASAAGGLAMTPGLATGVNRRCWYCGTYTSVTNLQDVRRICSPDWSACPSITTLNDGFRGTLNSGTCACNG